MVRQIYEKNFGITMGKTIKFRVEVESNGEKVFKTLKY